MDLLISHFSASTCLGDGGDINGAAFRCGYDGFTQVEYKFSDTQEQANCAPAINLEGLTGFNRFLAMLERTYQQLTDVANIELSTTPIFLCAASDARPDVDDARYRAEQLFMHLNERFKRSPHPMDRIVLQDRVATARALEMADQFLSDQTSHIVLMSVDSLMTPAALRAFEGDVGFGNGRILRSGEAHGFVPGEAAAACVVQRASTQAEGCRIDGISWAQESVLYSSSEPFRGQGIGDAVRAIQTMTNSHASTFDFLISSVSGESYYFEEVVMAQKRLKPPYPNEQPLWHPADQVGETGASAGLLALLQAYYGMKQGYAPGHSALMLLSNDDAHRVAMKIQYQGVARG
ncbi:hypothetical protein KDW99_01420 [Marinomonas rhizomae]|uniref:hypothetical protein n=1 Tax=Marinomonas rhizomae TaxID=491948 RepID=UPI002102051F|nr:hypothetical protein [Marinomonas rhizomae]UTV99836.1 hypothetical protein KDW99_01420 [Marinomonas rhizomae]